MFGLPAVSLLRGRAAGVAGYQQIVFAGSDKRIRRFPPGIIERVKAYELILPSTAN